jgi:hypothetical protein
VCVPRFSISPAFERLLPVVDLDLAALIAVGHGKTPLVKRRLRCAS